MRIFSGESVIEDEGSRVSEFDRLKSTFKKHFYSSMVKAWLGNCLLRCMEGFCDVNWFSSVIEGKKSASSVNTSLERHILNC